MTQLPSAGPVCGTPPRWTKSEARSCYPQSVAVRIFQVALPSRKALFVDGDPELFRDRVDILDIQVDERVWSSVTFVFGQIEPDMPARHRDEHRETRLELMVPLFLESQPLVPRDSPTGVLDIQDRDDFFVQPSELIGPP